MWDRVEELYCEYITQGSVVLMVDANAHTGANGDHRKDRAGKMLRRRAKKMHMTIINHTSMCKGKYSWMTERKNGTQSKTTIDYVMVSHWWKG